MRGKNKKIRSVVLGGAVIILLFFVISNILMMTFEKKKIASDTELANFDPDCLLVLGAAVWAVDRPSQMLADRLDEAITLYNKGVSKKIIVSGDHGRDDYDEVNTMKRYLIKAGIPGEDIFMDHAGFSTYESIKRAREIFGVNRVVVVTQQYHLYRALYICDRVGIDALGAPADPRTYVGKFKRNLREWIARDKDILFCLFKIKPKYLGEPIDIKGNGDVTNDRTEF